MTFDWLYHPVQVADRVLAGGLDGSGLVVVLVLAVLLGLRHATDPDHLVAVIALMQTHDTDERDAARLGAWWGAGHALILLCVGLPLALLESGVPSPLESIAERTVGVIIIVLALRVLTRWWRRPRLAGRPLIEAHVESGVRTAPQAALIGVVHGLGGTGAVVLLFAASLPSPVQAAVAIAVFAPMSVVSMALCTGICARLLRGHPLAYERVGMPGLALLSLLFGAWYAGVV
jgi:hypothetical protein